MAWKNLNQRSLAACMMIDHEAIKELDGIHASTRGEKAWPPLLMVKALLLQSWYKLSDPALGSVNNQANPIIEQARFSMDW